METKLNDNEVKEVARMQEKIDAYEGSNGDDLIWLAEMQDIFVDDEGNKNEEKQNK